MPGAYLIAGLVLILFALGFVKMSRHVKGGGAFHACIRHGLRRRAGGAAAYVALPAEDLPAALALLRRHIGMTMRDMN